MSEEQNVGQTSRAAVEPNTATGADPIVRELHQKAQEDVQTNELRGVMQIMASVIEKLASSDKTPATAIRAENIAEVDQHLKIFRSFYPPAFKGASNPLDAEDWLLQIEKILDGMICPEDRKVVLATFMLEGEAERWWRSQHLEKFLSRPLPRITWEEFTQVFSDWFIPPSARLALQEQFFNLRQGSKSIMQYEAEFTSLSRHAPHYVNTQQEKCHRFLRGLGDRMRLALAPFGISEFSILVERAPLAPFWRLDDVL